MSCCGCWGSVPVGKFPTLLVTSQPPGYVADPSRGANPNHHVLSILQSFCASNFITPFSWSSEASGTRSTAATPKHDTPSCKLSCLN